MVLKLLLHGSSSGVNLRVSVVDFGQVNVCRVALNCETKLEKITEAVFLFK